MSLSSSKSSSCSAAQRASRKGETAENMPAVRVRPAGRWSRERATYPGTPRRCEMNGQDCPGAPRGFHDRFPCQPRGDTAPGQCVDPIARHRPPKAGQRQQGQPRGDKATRFTRPRGTLCPTPSACRRPKGGDPAGVVRPSAAASSPKQVQGIRARCLRIPVRRFGLIPPPLCCVLQRGGALPDRPPTGRDAGGSVHGPWTMRDAFAGHPWPARIRHRAAIR